MIKELETYILEGRYDNAKELCERTPKEELRDIIINIAYDTENISIFSFALYMVQYNDKLYWLTLAIDLLINPLCFVEGAYSVALFCTRELLKIDKTAENLEKIVFFYNIPEKLITKDEALMTVEEILKIDPNNKVALEFK